MGQLPESISRRMRIPVIAAPMLRVSGVELVKAVCRGGAIGAFPTANARTAETLDDWLTELDEELGPNDAPYCPNLIMRREDIAQHVEVLLKHRVEVVITSVGSPASVMPALNEAGILTLADVATVRHARRAIEAGVGGLILLTAGAGGNTGWMNPFAFTRAVRQFFDGVIVMAGGMSDGTALHAAQVLGCDLGYMGTKFIATQESLAEDTYKQMVVDHSIDDVLLTRAFTGMDTNWLAPSIVAAGIDPKTHEANADLAAARAAYGSEAGNDGPRRWKDLWSVGHSISGVAQLAHAADIIEQTRHEYDLARRVAVERSSPTKEQLTKERS